MGRFHVGPSDESMSLREAYQANPDAFVAPTLEPQPTVEIQTQVVEKIIEVIREVKVPEYITVIKEVRVEVPVMMEVEKIVERIVEVPSIRVVEKPMPVIREVYDVTQVLLEKKAHDRTKRKLHITTIVLAFCLILTMIMAVK